MAYKRKRDPLTLPFWIDIEEHQKRLHDLIVNDPVIRRFCNESDGIVKGEDKRSLDSLRSLEHHDIRVKRLKAKIDEHRAAIRALCAQIATVYKRKASVLSAASAYKKHVKLWRGWQRTIEQRISVLHNQVARQMTNERTKQLDDRMLRKLEFHRKKLMSAVCDAMTVESFGPITDEVESCESDSLTESETEKLPKPESATAQ